MASKYCLIVDPFVSAKNICNALLDAGVKVLALITEAANAELKNPNRFPKELFSEVIFYSFANHTTILEYLAKYNIVRVIAGYEASIEIADQIAAVICPTLANPSDSSRARKNKYYMQEALKAVGLSTIKQMRLTSSELTESDKEQILSWKFPLIIKPCETSGSFGVQKCSNIGELEENLKLLYGTSPKLGFAVTDIVIQEYIKGEEFFIDTVSLNGVHQVVSCYSYYKTLHNNSPIYRYGELQDPTDERAQSCINYVKKVLDAVNIRNGFAHTEVFLTEQGPQLIEVNPRISGGYGFTNKLAWLASSRSQEKLLVESIINPDAFIKNYQQHPVLNMHGRIIFLQSWQEKYLKDFAYDNIEALPSCQEILLLKTKGDYLKQPKVLADTVAIVLLLHANKHQIVTDYQQLAMLEENGHLF